MFLVTNGLLEYLINLEVSLYVQYISTYKIQGRTQDRISGGGGGLKSSEIFPTFPPRVRLNIVLFSELEKFFTK